MRLWVLILLSSFFVSCRYFMGQNAPTNSNARAAALLGTVGVTIVGGTDEYTTSITFPSGTIIGVFPVPAAHGGPGNNWCRGLV